MPFFKQERLDERSMVVILEKACPRAGGDRDLEAPDATGFPLEAGMTARPSLFWVGVRQGLTPDP